MKNEVTLADYKRSLLSLFFIKIDNTLSLFKKIRSLLNIVAIQSYFISLG